MRTLALVAALLAVPAAAQSTEDAPPPEPVAEAASIDPALVGEWSLDEVVERGRLGELDVLVQQMACDFDADGTARVAMAVVQDLDPMETSRSFAFDTADGQIVVPDDDNVAYRLLDDGRLELETAGGLIVRLVRTGA